MYTTLFLMHGGLGSDYVGSCESSLCASALMARFGGSFIFVFVFMFVRYNCAGEIKGGMEEVMSKENKATKSTDLDINKYTYKYKPYSNFPTKYIYRFGINRTLL